MSQTQLRRTVTLDLNRGALDRAKRTVAFSFSSEYPVPMEGFDEVLDHSPGNVDLSLLTGGSHPLLLDHNPARQVGVIQKAWLDGRVGRGMAKISRGQLGEEALDDIEDGIRKNISVGYSRIREVSRKQGSNGRQLVRFAWKPHEISLVSLPADPGVGIGRSSNMEPENQNEPEDYPAEDRPNRAQRRAELGEDLRIKSIRAAVDSIAPGMPHLAQRMNQMAAEAILDRNQSAETFRSKMMALMQRNPPQYERMVVDESVGMSGAEVARYSLLGAVRSYLQHGRLEGLELEAHNACEKKYGQRAQGFFVPTDLWAKGTRDMSVTSFTQGGAFVQTTVLSSPIEILRNRMVCQRLGVQSMGGLSGNISLPRQTGAATAYSLAESAALTVANQAIDQVLLMPHRVGAVGKYSKQLLLQSTTDVENFIRDDLMKQVAIRNDYLILQGAGANSEPTGILNTNGIGSVTFGGTATWQKVINFQTQLALANADVGRMAFATTPSVREKWKTIAKLGTTFPLFLYEDGSYNDDSDDGAVNGFRTAVTNQILNNGVVFGNWPDAIFAMWGGFDVVVNPYTFDVNAQVQITINTFVDVALRHAASFCWSSDSGAQ